MMLAAVLFALSDVPAEAFSPAGARIPVPVLVGRLWD